MSYFAAKAEYSKRIGKPLGVVKKGSQDYKNIVAIQKSMKLPEIQQEIIKKAEGQAVIGRGRGRQIQKEFEALQRDIKKEQMQQKNIAGLQNIKLPKLMGAPKRKTVKKVVKGKMTLEELQKERENLRNKRKICSEKKREVKKAEKECKIAQRKLRNVGAQVRRRQRKMV